MDWQTSEDAVPSSFVTAAQRRSVLGKPPATGAWREGDDPGDRQFEALGTITLESGAELPNVRVAYETWGTLNPDGGNAVLITHALTGDSHVTGPASSAHPTAGWWQAIVGPGAAIDTDEWFVVVPNMLGGCQGSTGPAHLAPDGLEWAARFPFVTIRDQVDVQRRLMDRLGIRRWAAVIGGSMGGMQALEWAVGHPDRVERAGVLATPAVTTADQISLNHLQIEAIRLDPAWNRGDYYDARDGEGPHRGLSFARRLALYSYRAPDELNDRFQRSWQSEVSPLGDGGVYAVESYLDFHGNRFTRRFDANSYLTLVHAMNAHDVGRGRGGAEAALRATPVPTLVLGIDSDRLFPIADQRFIAQHLPNSISGATPIELSSPFGHDAFLIENTAVGAALALLFD